MNQAESIFIELISSLFAPFQVIPILFVFSFFLIVIIGVAAIISSIIKNEFLDEILGFPNKIWDFFYEADKKRWISIILFIILTDFLLRIFFEYSYENLFEDMFYT